MFLKQTEIVKIKHSIEYLCEKLMGEDFISNDIFQMCIVPDYDYTDIVMFIRWADKQMKQGIEPQFKEWFAEIVHDKTGAPSPRHYD